MPSLLPMQVLSVSDVVEVRDYNDKTWQIGTVIRFQEDQPRIRAEGFEADYFWDEWRFVVPKEESGDDEASEEQSVDCSSVDASSDEEESGEQPPSHTQRAGWRSWLRRGGNQGAEGGAAETPAGEAEKVPGATMETAQQRAWFKREKAKDLPQNCSPHSNAKQGDDQGDGDEEPTTLSGYFEMRRRQKREREVQVQREANAATAKEEIMSGKCPQGHVLADMVTDIDGFSCTICSKEFPANSTLRSCRGCDFDVCRLCVAEVTSEPQSPESPRATCGLSAEELPVWLFKKSLASVLSGEAEGWCALRSTDQARVNSRVALSAIETTSPEDENGEDKDGIFVRGGRWVIKPSERRLSPRYWIGKGEELRKCQWSWKDGKAWKPLGTEGDEERVEELYKFLRLEAVTAQQPSNESGKKGVVPPPKDIDLEFSDFALTFSVRGGEIAVHFKKEGWLWGKTFLHRGWGGEHEDIDDIDERPTGHLVLVVHGIGESLFARDDIRLPSVVEGIGMQREMARSLLRADEEKSGVNATTKVECLPIQWHHSLDAKKKRLARASLPSVLKVRDFSNEVVTDALFFLTPHWRKVMLDTAAARIRDVVKTFKNANPSWNVSSLTVVGHSLGTAILFELLTAKHLPESQLLPNIVPRHFIALGSPIAYIVDAQEEKPDWLNRRLARIRIQKHGHFRNLYHPNDPVAYRLEPLLVPCTHHLEKDSAAKSTERAVDSEVSLGSLIGIIPPVAVSSADPSQPQMTPTKTVEETTEPDPSTPDHAKMSSTTSAPPSLPFCQACYDSHVPQLSMSDETPADSRLRRRIDFALQIDAKSKLSRFLVEYWSALGAHNCYFTERDVTKFILDTICEDGFESGAGETAVNQEPECSNILAGANSDAKEPAGKHVSESSNISSGAQADADEPVDNQRHPNTNASVVSTTLHSRQPQDKTKLVEAAQDAEARGHTTFARLVQSSGRKSSKTPEQQRTCLRFHVDIDAPAPNTCKCGTAKVFHAREIIDDEQKEMGIEAVQLPCEDGGLAIPSALEAVSPSRAAIDVAVGEALGENQWANAQKY